MNRTLPILGLLAAMAVAAPKAPSRDVPLMTPVEAIAAIGKPEIRVRMVVRQSKERLEKRGIIYLDSEEHFKNPDNLGIAVSAKVAQSFIHQGIDDLAAHLKGRVIEVTGSVMRFEERCYMPVLNPEQLKVIESP